jgi:hypothetical protein
MQSLVQFGVGTAALTVVLSLTAPSFAQTMSFKSNLSATNEVPPVSSSATGTLAATYDPSTKTLSYTITYAGLSGDAMAAHFHGPASAGENAGVALPVSGAMTNPIKGTATLSDAQAKDLMSGKWYINIHTAANKGGELRGQVEKGM